MKKIKSNYFKKHFLIKKLEKLESEYFNISVKKAEINAEILDIKEKLSVVFKELK